MPSCCLLTTSLWGFFLTFLQLQLVATVQQHHFVTTPSNGLPYHNPAATELNRCCAKADDVNNTFCSTRGNHICTKLHTQTNNKSSCILSWHLENTRIHSFVCSQFRHGNCLTRKDRISDLFSQSRGPHASSAKRGATCLDTWQRRVADSSATPGSFVATNTARNIGVTLQRRTKCKLQHPLDAQQHELGFSRHVRNKSQMFCDNLVSGVHKRAGSAMSGAAKAACRALSKDRRAWPEITRVTHVDSTSPGMSSNLHVHDNRSNVFSMSGTNIKNAVNAAMSDAPGFHTGVSTVNYNQYFRCLRRLQSCPNSVHACFSYSAKPRIAIANSSKTRLVDAFGMLEPAELEVQGFVSVLSKVVSDSIPWQFVVSIAKSAASSLGLCKLVAMSTTAVSSTATTSAMTAPSQRLFMSAGMHWAYSTLLAFPRTSHNSNAKRGSGSFLAAASPTVAPAVTLQPRMLAGLAELANMYDLRYTDVLEHCDALDFQHEACQELLDQLEAIFMTEAGAIHFNLNRGKQHNAVLPHCCTSTNRRGASHEDKDCCTRQHLIKLASYHAEGIQQSIDAWNLYLANLPDRAWHDPRMANSNHNPHDDDEQLDRSCDCPGCACDGNGAAGAARSGGARRPASHYGHRPDGHLNGDDDDYVQYSDGRSNAGRPSQSAGRADSNSNTPLRKSDHNNNSSVQSEVAHDSPLVVFVITCITSAFLLTIGVGRNKRRLTKITTEIKVAFHRSALRQQQGVAAAHGNTVGKAGVQVQPLRGNAGAEKRQSMTSTPPSNVSAASNNHAKPGQRVGKARKSGSVTNVPPSTVPVHVSAKEQQQDVSAAARVTPVSTSHGILSWLGFKGYSRVADDSSSRGGPLHMHQQEKSNVVKQGNKSSDGLEHQATDDCSDSVSSFTMDSSSADNVSSGSSHPGNHSTPHGHAPSPMHEEDLDLLAAIAAANAMDKHEEEQRRREAENSGWQELTGKSKGKKSAPKTSVITARTAILEAAKSVANTMPVRQQQQQRKASTSQSLIHVNNKKRSPVHDTVGNQRTGPGIQAKGDTLASARPNGVPSYAAAAVKSSGGGGTGSDYCTVGSPFASPDDPVMPQPGYRHSYNQSTGALPANSGKSWFGWMSANQAAAAGAQLDPNSLLQAASPIRTTWAGPPPAGNAAGSMAALKQKHMMGAAGWDPMSAMMSNPVSPTPSSALSAARAPSSNISDGTSSPSSRSGIMGALSSWFGSGVHPHHHHHHACQDASGLATASRGSLASTTHSTPSRSSMVSAGVHAAAFDHVDSHISAHDLPHSICDYSPTFSSASTRDSVVSPCTSDFPPQPTPPPPPFSRRPLNPAAPSFKSHAHAHITSTTLPGTVSPSGAQPSVSHHHGHHDQKGVAGSSGPAVVGAAQQARASGHSTHTFLPTQAALQSHTSATGDLTGLHGLPSNAVLAAAAAATRKLKNSSDPFADSSKNLKSLKRKVTAANTTKTAHSVANDALPSDVNTPFINPQLASQVSSAAYDTAARGHDGHAALMPCWSGPSDSAHVSAFEANHYHHTSHLPHAMSAAATMQTPTAAVSSLSNYAMFANSSVWSTDTKASNAGGGWDAFTASKAAGGQAMNGGVAGMTGDICSAKDVSWVHAQTADRMQGHSYGIGVLGTADLHAELRSHDLAEEMMRHIALD